MKRQWKSVNYLGVRGGDGKKWKKTCAETSDGENIKAAILRRRRRSARWKCSDGGRTGGAAEGEEEGRQGERRLRGCCGLIIWLFMQKDESPPIRVGDL